MTAQTKIIKPKRADLIITAVLLTVGIAAAIILFCGKSSDKAIIAVNGETAAEFILKDAGSGFTYTADSGVKVLIEQDGVTVVFSPCKGQDCVRCGKLTVPGSMAVCAPAKTVVYITGTKAKSPDAITY